MSSTFVANSTAYSQNNGIQLGDTINVWYVGTALNDNGQTYEFDSNENARFTVAYNQLIEGFVDGLLGMKIGDVKTIIVPPDKGYDNDPNHELYNKELTFEVKLLSVVGVASTAAPPEPEPNQFLEGFVVFLQILGGLVGIILVYVFVIPQFRKTTGYKCITCGKAYEGQCANCDTTYCRQHFGRRCKNCKSNRFIPN